MYKLDLHTHSVASPDGSLTLADYRRMLDSGGLDYIAITDHDTLDFALQARQALGEQIIVGQEIGTQEGELIGLYLSKAVPPGLSLAETIQRIQDQGGLVYVPHPFETSRQGIKAAGLEAILSHIAIVETTNGRAIFQSGNRRAGAWAQAHQLPGACSSDAHGRHGWGRTYMLIDRTPDVSRLPTLCAAARFIHRRGGLRAVLYPKFNRLRRASKRT